MKPPEEIKKDLGRCLDRWAPVHFESCESDCPYHSEGTLCKSTLHSEVIAYIQRLESRLAQVERERDAAVKCAYDVHEEVFKPVSATLDAEKALTNVGAIIAKWLLDTARAANTEGGTE